MKKVIWCICSLLLVAYMIVIMYCFVSKAIDGKECTSMHIEVADTATNRFVTAEEIIREIDSLPYHCQGMLLKNINTDSIERQLNSIDKIESASCVVLTDGRIVVSVIPMKPVARVFEENYSYYINRTGKRISSDARYHLDVPVLSGNFDSTHQAVSLLPLVDYINADSTLTSLVSMIKIDNRHNIILVPSIRGHVINFGDINNIENKFVRLRRIYEDVLPVKGWDFYDTIAVKWDGQVVATRRIKKLIDTTVKYDEEIENEAPEVGSMIADESTDTTSVKNHN